MTTPYKARGTVGLEIANNLEIANDHMVYFTPAASSTVAVGTQKYAVFLDEGEGEGEDKVTKAVAKRLDVEGRVRMSVSGLSEDDQKDNSKVASRAVLINAAFTAAVTRSCFVVSVKEKDNKNIELVSISL